MKIERQVRFTLGHQNVFLELVWKRKPKTHFELQTSNFEKIIEVVLGAFGGQKTFLWTRGVLWNQFGPSRMD